MCKRKSFNELVIEANKVHNNKYKYEELFYKNSEGYLKIICKKHGEFSQKHNKHLKGQGCRLCGFERTRKAKIKSFKEWVSLANKTHNNKYTYKDIFIKNNLTYLTIICKEHGEFKQPAPNHIKGSGCKYCAGNYKKSLEEWKDIGNTDKYEYLNTFSKYNKTHLKIKCKEHNEVFTQTQDSHFIKGGDGCPKCKKFGKKEQEIVDFLKSVGVTNTIMFDRELIKPYELDIYLPDYNLAIEYTGLIWHSEKFRKDNLTNIENKRKLCKSKGINLITIYEDDWLFKTDIIKSIIKNKLGLTKNKVYGRKTIIKEVDTKTYNEFNTSNHIMGSRNAKFKIGLFNKEELVAVAGFSNNELIRYTVKQDYSVIGGLGKITKWFINNVSDTLMTYVDLDYFEGNSYKQVGYKEINITKPKYWYVGNKQKRFPRQSFQKHKLLNIFSKFNKDLTEYENCNINGFYRLFGCSNLKLVYTK